MPAKPQVRALLLDLSTELARGLEPLTACLCPALLLALAVCAKVLGAERVRGLVLCHRLPALLVTSARKRWAKRWVTRVPPPATRVCASTITGPLEKVPRRRRLTDPAGRVVVGRSRSRWAVVLRGLRPSGDGWGFPRPGA